MTSPSPQTQMQDGNEKPATAAPAIDQDEPDCGLQPSELEIQERRAQESAHMTKEQSGWRKVVRSFTPSLVF
ncbi:hypothetical protein MMC20_005120 [Loxospora ochrophaea]|nr:hypothetical protein [Loxospora ochrophaea]